MTTAHMPFRRWISAIRASVDHLYVTSGAWERDEEQKLRTLYGSTRPAALTREEREAARITSAGPIAPAAVFRITGPDYARLDLGSAPEAEGRN